MEAGLGILSLFWYFVEKLVAVQQIDKITTHNILLLTSEHFHLVILKAL